MHTIESAIHYIVAGKRYIGVALADEGVESVAAVVLLPDWRGQSQLARDHAHGLVAIGCTVVIADLYGDGFSPDDPGQVGPLVKRLMENRADGVAALSACVAALRDRVGAQTPLFCLGYSAGGMVALDHGRSGADVAGIIVCSALLKTAEPGMSPHIGAPVLILQGTQDQVSPIATITDVITEMDEAGNDFRLELYGQTHHAFDNPEAGTDPTARLVYSPAAALLAKRAIIEFVGKHTTERPRT